MKVGIMIEGQEGLTWERWFRLAQAAEDLGYESLCRSDHLTGLGGESKRPSLETWTSLAALATRTKRIRFGPMVSPLTFYHPALLAKMAAAVDTLSGGRLDLGLGAGWNEHEHRMFGVPFLTLKERLDRLEAGARLIRSLEKGQPVTLKQPHFPLEKAESFPLPATGRYRIVIGGRGEKRTLKIVAEFADEWNVTRVDIPGFVAEALRAGRALPRLRPRPGGHRALAHGSLRHRARFGRGREAHRRHARHLPRPARRRGRVARGVIPRGLAGAHRRGPQGLEAGRAPARAAPEPRSGRSPGPRALRARGHAEALTVRAAQA